MLVISYGLQLYFIHDHFQLDTARLALADDQILKILIEFLLFALSAPLKVKSRRISGNLDREELAAKQRRQERLKTYIKGIFPDIIFVQCPV